MHQGTSGALSVNASSSAAPANPKDDGHGHPAMSAEKFERYTRLMLAGAAAMLVLTVALHAIDYPEIDRLLLHSSIPEIWRSSVRVVWILYGTHLLIVAAVFGYACARPTALAGPWLMLCGLIPALDAVFLLIYVGSFTAPMLLAFAAVLAFGAVARRTMTFENGTPGQPASRGGR